jgi:hypothetical protein
MTKVNFIRTHQSPPKIAQSRMQRDWMDETYNKHAYQCLPMTIANVYGWEMQMEDDLVVQWDGGQNPARILSGEYSSSGRLQAVSSIVGMISIQMSWVIRTEEGYSTWFTGPPNYFPDGASPLTATIPTWWWPDESQMNWKITKTGEPVTFAAGSPFCFFNVYDNSVMPGAEVTSSSLWDDMNLIESRAKYGQMKSQNMTENPWTWTKGIKTGVDADGKQIGPTFTGMPKLANP